VSPEEILSLRHRINNLEAAAAENEEIWRCEKEALINNRGDPNKFLIFCVQPLLHTKFLTLYILQFRAVSPRAGA